MFFSILCGVFLFFIFIFLFAPMFYFLILLAIKKRGFHPEIFKLEDGEEIVKMAKGDYWSKEWGLQEIQNSDRFAFTSKNTMRVKKEWLFKDPQVLGEFAFTNKRIIFKCTNPSSITIEDINIPYSREWFSALNEQVLESVNRVLSSGMEVSIPYGEIANIREAFVIFFPVAFIVTTKGGREYKFSIKKHSVYVDLITSLARGANN